jgi:hypothetical protein
MAICRTKNLVSGPKVFCEIPGTTSGNELQLRWRSAILNSHHKCGLLRSRTTIRRVLDDGTTKRFSRKLEKFQLSIDLQATARLGWQACWPSLRLCRADSTITSHPAPF